MRFGLLAALAMGVAVCAAPLVARADDAVDTVRVEMAKPSDTGVTLVLERIIEGTSLWESICVGTCDSNVSREGQYRVTGRGVRPSPSLTLVPDNTGARSDTVHLSASVAYASGWVGGVLLTILGPVVGISGGLAIAFDQTNTGITNTPPCTSNGCATIPPPSNAPIIGGAITVGLGVAMTVAGIIAIVTTDHTNVHQRATATLSARSLTLAF